MAYNGFLAVVLESDGIHGDAASLRNEGQIARMEDASRIEPAGGTEVPAAGQKADLIDRRTQAGGNALQGEREIKTALALGAVEQRWGFEGALLKAVQDVHARHGLPLDFRSGYYGF